MLRKRLLIIFLSLLPVVIGVLLKRQVDLRPRPLALTYQTGSPLTLSPDQNYLATRAESSDAIVLMDLRTGETRVLQSKNVDDFYNWRTSCDSIAFTSDSKRLIGGGKPVSDYLGGSETLNVWDVKTGRHIKAFGWEKTRGPAVALAHNDDMLVTGGENNTLLVWSVKKSAILKTVPLLDTTAALTFSRDGKYLISSGPITLWDTKTWRALWTAQLGHKPLNSSSVIFAADEKTVFVAQADNAALQINVADGSVIRAFSPSTKLNENNTTNRVACSPDGRWLITSGYQGAYLWDLKTTSEPDKIAGSGDAVFQSDSSRYYIGDSGFSASRIRAVLTCKLP